MKRVKNKVVIVMYDDKNYLVIVSNDVLIAVHDDYYYVIKLVFVQMNKHRYLNLVHVHYLMSTNNLKTVKSEAEY